MTGSDLSISYQIEWVTPEPDLTDLVNTFYVVRAGAVQIQDMMPAYSAQVLICVEGHGLMHFPSANTARAAEVNFIAPLLEAIPFELQGPLLQVGASLTPLGWVTLSGLAAGEVNNRSVAAEDLLSSAQLATLRAQIETCRSGQIDPTELCVVLGDVLRSIRRDPNSSHVSVLQSINIWLASSLNPKLAELYSNVSVSERQVQRLCRRYFGVPPVQLLARYRAIRTALLLANEELPVVIRDEVLGAYFDQAHMIRDVRRYTGKTPKGFTEDTLGQDTLDPVAHGKNARIILSNPNTSQLRTAHQDANDSQESGFG